MPPTDDLAERNRGALKLLFEAAQALSDGERDYAVRLQRQAARRLRLVELGQVLMFLLILLVVVAAAITARCV